MSGKLKLKCEGRRVLRAHVRTNDAPAHLDRRHHFTTFGVKLGIQVLHHDGIKLRVTASKLTGRVHRARAAGFLRLVAGTERSSRVCDTGRLHWHAHFVPRD